MRYTGKSVTWVVYRMTLPGSPTGMPAVCEQGEWEAMERAKPGYHALVRAGIATEAEAERLARNVPADGTASPTPDRKLPGQEFRPPQARRSEEVNP